MFVETIEPDIEDGELIKLRVRMGDKRVIDFVSKQVSKGYLLILSYNKKLVPLITDNPRAEKYDPRWLDSLEFKLQLEGIGTHVVYGGVWLMQAYSMYRMGEHPMAIKWLISINRMESTISSYSLKIDRLPAYKNRQIYGKRLQVALDTFGHKEFDDFVQLQVSQFQLSDYIQNYRDRS